MQKKEFSLKQSDLGAGRFVGLASVYGNVDRDGEAVQPGAFTKTLLENGARIKILWQHDRKVPIGLGRLADGAGGLWVDAQLTLGTSAGRDAYELLKAGVIDTMSIGYDVIKQVKRSGVTYLTELKLWEVSLVTFPANELAVVTGVKAGGDEACAAAFDLVADLRSFADEANACAELRSMRTFADVAATMMRGRR